MVEFIATAISFPVVVYTVLLSVCLLYWGFVVVGAAHINLLGEGAADGAIDGAADAGLEGVAKGAAEGVADHFDGGGGHADAGDAGDVGDAADGHQGLPGMLAALRLRSAPATVVLSTIVLFSWLFSVLGMQGAQAWVPAGAMSLARFAVLFLAPILALPFTSIAVRPLARIFVPQAVTERTDLVGKVCTIRTGKVTDRFGEAMLEDGGAQLVLRVRIDTSEKLARGDRAVIVGYDEDRQEFTVAPMDDGLSDPKSRQARR